MSKLTLAGHTSIRVSTLAKGRELEFDVFVPIDGRGVRFAAKGVTFDHERFERLREFKINKVFISETDEANYRTYLDTIFKEAEENDKMELSTRTDVVGSRAEVAAQAFKDNPTSKEAFLDSTDAFMRLGRFLSSVDASSNEILRHSGTRPDDYEFHGLQVGVLSLKVAKSMDLIKRPEQTTALLTAAFFHDIGAEQLGIGLNDAEARTGSRKAEWLKHPDLSIQHLQGKSYVDPLVIELIAQHEETLNGSGFPRQLSQKSLHPIGQVLSLCNRFDHYSTQHGGNIAVAVKAFVIEQLGRYDLTAIKKIEEIFGALKI